MPRNSAPAREHPQREHRVRLLFFAFCRQDALARENPWTPAEFAELLARFQRDADSGKRS